MHEMKQNKNIFFIDLKPKFNTILCYNTKTVQFKNKKNRKTLFIR